MLAAPTTAVAAGLPMVPVQCRVARLRGSLRRASGEGGEGDGRGEASHLATERGAVTAALAMAGRWHRGGRGMAVPRTVSMRAGMAPRTPLPSALPRAVLIALSPAALGLPIPREGDVFGHFTGRGVLASTIKITALKGLGFWAVRHPISQEDMDALQGHELFAAKTIAKKLAEGVAKDMGKIAVRTSLENWFIRNKAPQDAARLVASVSRVAVDKAQSEGRLWAALGMAETAFFACMLEHFSVFCIEASVNAFVALYRALRPLLRPGAQAAKEASYDESFPRLIRRTPPESQPVWWQATLKVGQQALGSVATEAVGASIGTLIWPGTGTFIGALLGGTVCYLVI